MQLSGKVIVITGASKGIGAAAAHAFVAAGGRVALLARDRAALAGLARDLGPGAIALPCNVSHFDDMTAALGATHEAFGRIDVIVNNAGVMGPMARMALANPDDWAQAIDVNLKGVFHGMRAVLPYFLAQGGGTVLTVSSGAAHRPTDGWSAYCASKAGAAMLTRSLHLEYAGAGIRAMGLSPGTVATDMQRNIKQSGVGPIAALDWSVHIPADWPARALVWMCSPESDAFLGEEISLRDLDMRARVGLV